MTAPRCKPGQMAMVVRASTGKPCSRFRTGVPVVVERLLTWAEAWDLCMDHEGHVWLLREPIACPYGFLACRGITALPDNCLKPFDPDVAEQVAPAPSEATA